MQEQNLQNDGARPKKKVELIPNPLPGPKPHVKKTMGYDYDVPPDKMRFDIENPREMYYDHD